MKPDILTLLKTLQLSLENGKSLTNALNLLQNTTKNKDERIAYGKITRSIQEGASFSKAVEKYVSPSPDIIQFVAMAEKGGSFVKTLKSVVSYLEIKNKFHQESNDKIALPMIYFTLTATIIIFVRFFAVPFHIQEAKTYDPKIFVIIAEHLDMALALSNLLFGGLLLFSAYFFIVMIALFNYTGIVQGIAKRFASRLPMSSKIIEYFEKFILLSLLSAMLKNGVSLKTAFKTAAAGTLVPSIAKQFNGILAQVSRGEKNFWTIPFFEDIEQHLLAGAGTVTQLGDILEQFADRARLNALAMAGKFFRIITILAILLLAFAVFVEFFTIVLTQVLIQQEIVNSAGRA
ncbi:MAG: type II secretion system F family protein [Sulfuricurvum sp.]|uniref:type II secretion system F family protein n=1 Tax=Sulfuricurvum sp. TaxID=2025608 RepID=UPI00271A7BD9|nr:type II secretion system F family protein [Sulfuricurvum sp.]MDO9056439.1 type II secretion system F family protein [Sulfuricurvum sp.]MDP2849947.1 type II secretion system F family protein [Sulfuricurvum sp.]MDP3292609.1 type II secretion system F family protein [Sulfuricurvum sp.]